jgi:hypothetical protein
MASRRTPQKSANTTCQDIFFFSKELVYQHITAFISKIKLETFRQHGKKTCPTSYLKSFNKRALVVHACNLGYSGGGIGRITV